VITITFALARIALRSTQHGGNVAPLQTAEDRHAHTERVENAHACGFGSGGQPNDGRPDHEHGHQEWENALVQPRQDLGRVELHRFDGVAAPPRDDRVDRHLHQTDEDPRNGAGEEKAAHRL